MISDNTNDQQQHAQASPDPLAMLAAAISQLSMVVANQQADQNVFRAAMEQQNNVLQQTLFRSPTVSPPTSEPSLSVALATFHGQSAESVGTWLFQVERVFTAKGIRGEERKIAFAASALREAALQWFQNISTSDEVLTFDDFKDKITAAFQPANFQRVLRRQLKALRQTGSISDYVYEFRNIVGQIKEMAEDDKITYFIDGLKPRTREEINYMAPETLENAIASATRFDAAMFGVNSPLPRPLRQHVSQSSATPPSGLTAASRLYPTPISSGTVEPMDLDVIDQAKKMEFRRKGLCFKCGQRGHLSKECTMSPHQGNATGQ